jgi:hypothetical protein
MLEIEAKERRPQCSCLRPPSQPLHVCSDFFKNGKTLPVERGSSVHQRVINTAGALVGAGGWLHVFPEGRVQPGGDVGLFRQVTARQGGSFLVM